MTSERLENCKAERSEVRSFQRMRNNFSAAFTAHEFLFLQFTLSVPKGRHKRIVKNKFISGDLEEILLFQIHFKPIPLHKRFMKWKDTEEIP
jgi:hypothetical protein